MSTVQTDAWYKEALAMDPLDRDWDVASCADIPEELFVHIEAAALDDNLDDELLEWREYVCDGDVATLMLLALEQSCCDGVLLPWDQRGVRLLSSPWEVLMRLDRFNRACPRHVAAMIAFETYWVVRSERARRTGSTLWSPRPSMTVAQHILSLATGQQESRWRNGYSSDH